MASAALVPVVIGTLVLSLTVGCVREGPPMRDPPRPAASQPAGIEPDRAVLFAQQMGEDTNGNGYPDRFPVTLLFFNSRHAPSIEVRGELVLYLEADGERLASWTYSPEQIASMGGKVPSGWGYPFALDLNQGGTDRMTQGRAQLSGRFTPLSGAQPVAIRGATLIVGR